MIECRIFLIIIMRNKSDTQLDPSTSFLYLPPFTELSVIYYNFHPPIIMFAKLIIDSKMVPFRHVRRK